MAAHSAVAATNPRSSSGSPCRRLFPAKSKITQFPSSCFGRKPRPTICRYKDRLIVGRVSMTQAASGRSNPSGGDGYVNQRPDGSILELVDQLGPLCGWRITQQYPVGTRHR